MCVFQVVLCNSRTSQLPLQRQQEFHFSQQRENEEETPLLSWQTSEREKGLWQLLSCVNRWTENTSHHTHTHLVEDSNVKTLKKMPWWTFWVKWCNRWRLGYSGWWKHHKWPSPRLWALKHIITHFTVLSCLSIFQHLWQSNVAYYEHVLTMFCLYFLAKSQLQRFDTTLMSEQ